MFVQRAMRGTRNLHPFLLFCGLITLQGCSSPPQPVAPSINQPAAPSINNAQSVAAPKPALSSLDAQKTYMSALVKSIDNKGKNGKGTGLMFFFKDPAAWNLITSNFICKDKIDKIVFTTQINIYREAAKSISSISPVPESFRDVDNQFSSAGVELDRCADTLSEWRDETDVDKARSLGKEAFLHHKKAESLLQSGLDDAKRIMNSSSKVYTKN